MAERVLMVGLLFGVVADQLLGATTWGLNVPVLVLVIILAGVALSRWGAVELEGEGRWLVLPMLLFSGALAWRDSPTLNVANALALLVIACLAALTTRAGQVRLAGVSQYASGVVYLLACALGGGVPLLRREIAWHDMRRGWWSGPALAMGRGLVLAVPPLIIFGALFVAADATFENVVEQAFAANSFEVIGHLLLALLYAWLFVGVMREMLLVPLRVRPDLGASGIRLSIVEVGVVLALIDVLFLVFAVIQLPYLFGGLSQVQQMGYSAYARRGFFELVWVAGLSLPLLLVAHWLVRAEGRGAQRVYGALATVLVLLLFVIMASAMQRMALYVADSGLTELRLQASVFMAWLAIVLVLFLSTVVRGRRRQFGFGALVSAMLVIGALDVANPDGLIVETNARYGHLVFPGDRDAALVGDSFDHRPLASFSADATPAIVAALPTLKPADRAAIAQRLQRSFATSSTDWRAYNRARVQAVQAVASLKQQQPATRSNL